MKKNMMMRLASVLLVATLLSTCAISGTFAKYVTTATADDSARVAKWGFTTSSITFENLFDKAYTNVAAGTDEMAIIAPGTSGEVAFQFVNTTTAPEVAYTFVVDATESSCADAIKKNANIQWALAKTTEKATATYGNWDALIAAINALDGDKEYAAGEIPTMVDTEYTILWKWNFNNADDGINDNDNFNDTDLGNLAATGDLVVTLKVTITATQVD